MATCPRCKGYLAEGHRCRRYRGSAALEMLACGLCGGFAALLLIGAFDPRAEDLDTVGFAIGGLLAVGINRALRS